MVNCPFALALTGLTCISALFVDSKAGQRVAIKVLTHFSNLIDAPESTVEATVCDIGCVF